MEFKRLCGATNVDNRPATLLDEYFGFKKTGEKVLQINGEEQTFAEHWLLADDFLNRKEELIDLDNLLKFIKNVKNQTLNSIELKKFIEQFADQFEDTDPAEITATTVFHDLDEWDSLMALAVLNMCEKKFGKKITFDDMKACVTVENLYNVVNLK